MMNSLHIAATGMHSQQHTIDVIANNLANMNTSGYKKTRVGFEDLMYSQIARNNGLLGATGTSMRLGMGAGVASSNKVFIEGDIRTTDNPLDMAIRGDGFFEVLLPDGSQAYTRTGTFQIDAEQMLVTSDGYLVNPMISVPSDTEELLVGADGTVLARLAGDDEPTQIGQIELARFVNASGLDPIGDNLYRPSHLSGDAIYAMPGEEGAGLVAQGFIETSNVQLVEELTQLMLAQRAYEVNSKVIQAADQLLGIINNLRR